MLAWLLPCSPEMHALDIRDSERARQMAVAHRDQYYRSTRHSESPCLLPMG